MRAPVLRLHDQELIVDNFAGGGGASLGIEWALGRSPDLAVNHDPEAIAMHQANHPETRHLCGNVWDVRPKEVCAGRPVGLAWFSPDCTFHSKARGGKPFRDPKQASGRRGLAWVVVRWARDVRPRVICLENVEEFADWGPLLEDGRPCPDRRGLTFRRWLGQLKAAGYEVEMRELRACDYGAPTSRKRLFVIARCDGRPIVWPGATHGRAGIPHRTAAECIQWERPCPSIFERVKPLAEKTLARIARGVQRFVLDSAQPFVIRSDMHQSNAGCVYPIHDPLRTITTGGSHALVSPTLIHSGNGERSGQDPRVYDLHRPLGTVMAEGVKHALVAAFLSKHNGGHEATGTAMVEPMHTITARDHHALSVAHLLKFYGSCPDGQRVDAPAPTIRAQGTHLAEVRAFLTRFNGTGDGQGAQLPLGTVTTRDRFGLVTVAGESYAITDLGMRMLQPRELFRAQGFPDTYEIEVEHEGRTLPKGTQVRMVGNSVSPPVAAAIVAANVDAKRTARVA